MIFFWPSRFVSGSVHLFQIRILKKFVKSVKLFLNYFQIRQMSSLETGKRTTTFNNSCIFRNKIKVLDLFVLHFYTYSYILTCKKYITNLFSQKCKVSAVAVYRSIYRHIKQPILFTLSSYRVKCHNVNLFNSTPIFFKIRRYCHLNKFRVPQSFVISILRFSLTIGLNCFAILKLF